MKAKGLLFIVMALCLTSGVRAQFYDGPNDIYYYVVETEDGTPVSKSDKNVWVFNFDGRKACQLAIDGLKSAQTHLRENPDYYGAMVENKKYDMEYTSSSYGICYVLKDVWEFTTDAWGTRTVYQTNTYTFSRDRTSLTVEDKRNATGPTGNSKGLHKYVLRKVDKNYILNGFFGEGRQRK